MDEDTPVEDGTIVCVKKAGFEGSGGGREIGTTVIVTTTGKPIALATITNAANLTLPTGAPGSANSARARWSAMAAAAALCVLQFVLY